MKTEHNKKPLGSKINKTTKILEELKSQLKRLKEISVSLNASTTVIQLLIKKVELFLNEI